MYTRGLAHLTTPVAGTTRFSNAVTARYGPVSAWDALFRFIFEWVAPSVALQPQPLVPSVRPKYTKAEILPADAEKQAVAAAIRHLTETSQLLYSPLATPPTDLATLHQHCPVAANFTAHADEVTCIDEGLSDLVSALGQQTREMGTCPACGCTTKGSVAVREKSCANTRTDDIAQSAIGIGVAGVLLDQSKYKTISMRSVICGTYNRALSVMPCHVMAFYGPSS